MGREIEVKIPLTKEEYEKFYTVFVERKTCINGINLKSGNGSEKIQVLKLDEYYSKYTSREERIKNNEPQVIRLRTEKKEGKSESYFTIKRKKWQNGIELNQEDETFIEDPEVLKEFFEVAGYEKWFSKEKKAYGSWCTSSSFKISGKEIEFHVELETVNKMPYLEIEVVQTEGDADFIKNSLFGFVEKLGINPDRKDARSWVEILSEKQA